MRHEELHYAVTFPPNNSSVNAKRDVFSFIFLFFIRLLLLSNCRVNWHNDTLTTIDTLTHSTIWLPLLYTTAQRYNLSASLTGGYIKRLFWCQKKFWSIILQVYAHEKILLYIRYMNPKHNYWNRLVMGQATLSQGWYSMLYIYS